MTQRRPIPPPPLAGHPPPPVPPAFAPDETDGIGARLAWAGAFAGLLLLDGGLVWLAVWGLTDSSGDLWGRLGFLWVVGLAILGATVALVWVWQKIRLAMAGAALTHATRADVVDAYLAAYTDYWGVVLDTQQAYNRRWLRDRSRPRRTMEVRDQAGHVYEIYTDTGERVPDDPAVIDVDFVSRETPTQHLPPGPAMLTSTQRLFLAAVVQGQDYSWRRLEYYGITRGQYTACVTSLRQAGIIVPRPGQTFGLAAPLVEWRAGWLAADTLPGPERTSTRAAIEAQAADWCRRALAGDNNPAWD